MNSLKQLKICLGEARVYAQKLALDNKIPLNDVEKIIEKIKGVEVSVLMASAPNRW